VTDDTVARSLRERLWAEHRECDAATLAGTTPTELVDGRWWPRAEEQRARLDRSEAPTHRLALLRGVSPHARGLLGPIDGLLVDG